ncbi:hypothetical protein CLOM_g3628 [Closterium sp. NIES-68]|nr:hypothetical protein CLOM_g3628 [Closterium sp. NIES-68]
MDTLKNRQMDGRAFFGSSTGQVKSEVSPALLLEFEEGSRQPLKRRITFPAKYMRLPGLNLAHCCSLMLLLQLVPVRYGNR